MLQGGPRNKRRPYSADGQFLVSNRPARRDKNATIFPRSQEDSLLDHSESEKDNYQLSSSTLLNSLASDDPNDGAWADMRGIPLTSRPVDLDTNESLTNTSDLICTFSDISEEPSISEKSLGERICEMAQNSTCETSSKARIIPESEVPKAPKTVEEDLDEEDTRNLSNRELHFRMIAAGLISRPGSENIQAENQQSDIDVMKKEDCTVAENGSRGTKPKEEECIGDSATESSKFSRRTVTFGEEDIGVSEAQVGDEDSSRPKVPVRFQEWVTTNNPSSPAKTEFSSLFCSTQLYPFRQRKSDLFLECMVEEILDEEQGKLQGLGTAWAKPAGNSDEKEVTISTWPASAGEESKNDRKERVVPIEKEYEKVRGNDERSDYKSAEKPQCEVGNDETLISSTTTVEINKSTIPPPSIETDTGEHNTLHIA